MCCIAIYMFSNMLDRRVRRSKRPIDRPDMPRSYKYQLYIYINYIYI
jgi:hypothetical protein